MFSIKGDFPGYVEHLDCSQISRHDATKLLFALFRHRILVIRGQALEPEQFARFMRMLGPTVPHILRQFRVDDLPDVIAVSNLYLGDGRPMGIHEGGAYWHTDMSYLSTSGVLTALYSTKVPSTGGATEFIDGVGALRCFRAQVAQGAIPFPISRLDRPTTRVRHQFGNRDKRRHRQARSQTVTDQQLSAVSGDISHPLVMPHPVIGVESLYAVAGSSYLVDGLTVDESCDALDWLFDFMRTSGPRYSHAYARGDLVLWDNISTMHCGTEIAPSHDPDNCRLLLRANVNYVAALNLIGDT